MILTFCEGREHVGISGHHAPDSVKHMPAASDAGQVERHGLHGLAVQINLHTVARFEIHLMIAYSIIQLNSVNERFRQRIHGKFWVNT
jgi:hypothetical protein